MVSGKIKTGKRLLQELTQFLFIKNGRRNADTDGDRQSGFADRASGSDKTLTGL